MRVDGQAIRSEIVWPERRPRVEPVVSRRKPVTLTPRQAAIAAMLLDAKYRPHDGQRTYLLENVRAAPEKP